MRNPRKRLRPTSLADCGIGLVYRKSGWMPVGMAIGLFLLFFSAPILAQLEPINRAEERNNAGAQLAVEGNYKGAIEAFLEAIKVAPNFAAAYYNLGMAHSRLQEHQSAIKAFGAAVQIQPDYGDAWYQLAIALQEAGQFEKAAKAYEITLPFKPDNPNLQYRLGFVYAKLNDWSRVVSHWEVLIDRYPDHSTVLSIQKDLPLVYYNLGTVQQDAGKMAEAEVAYDQALRWLPDYSDAHYNLGLIYKSQGRSIKAVASFLQVLKFRPDNSGVRMLLGEVYAKADSLEQAIDQFRIVLEEDPGNVSALNRLVRALLGLGETEAALTEAERGISLEPKSWVSYGLLALVHEHNTEGERYGPGFPHLRAIEAYQEGLRIEEIVGLYYNLGILYGRLEDWTHARESLQKAWAVDSTHAGVRKWLPEVEWRYQASKNGKGGFFIDIDK